MKNYSLMIPGTKSVIQIAILFILSLFLVSCSTEEAEMQEDLSVYNLLENTSASSKAKMNNAAPAPGEDPIALIAINGRFTQLVDALLYVDEELNAGLVDLFLNGKSQYTVFAPTDAAFYSLYEALEVTSIREVDPALVLNVLSYHVVEGRRAANSVVPPRQPRAIETLLGVNFRVDKNANIWAVGNTANFVATNVSASNGIIHVIDTVLLPVQL